MMTMRLPDAGTTLANTYNIGKFSFYSTRILFISWQVKWLSLLAY